MDTTVVWLRGRNFNRRCWRGGRKIPSRTSSSEGKKVSLVKKLLLLTFPVATILNIWRRLVTYRSWHRDFSRRRTNLSANDPCSYKRKAWTELVPWPLRYQCIYVYILIKMKSSFGIKVLDGWTWAVWISKLVEVSGLAQTHLFAWNLE